MQDRYHQLDENLLLRTAGPYMGSVTTFQPRPRDFRLFPNIDRNADIARCLKGAKCRSRDQLNLR